MPVKPPTFRPAHQVSRPVQRVAYERERREREPWRNWYKLAVWLRLRAAQLTREPLCECCLIEYERIVPATVVHHREPHHGIWERFLDPDNLASVCKDCHDGEIQRGERAGWTTRGWQVEGHTIPPRIVQPLGLKASAIPLVMVCGPPGAGKSTYISERMADGDTLIDIDAILSGLSGTEVRTQERRDRFLTEAFIERNKRLAALATAKPPARAWFIVGAPGPSVRQCWADQLKPAEVVVFETVAGICIDRIKAAPDRTETAAGMIAGVHAWWDRYDRTACDSAYFKG